MSANSKNTPTEVTKETPVDGTSTSSETTNTKVNNTKVNNTKVNNTKINNTKVNNTKVNNTKVNNIKVKNIKTTPSAAETNTELITNAMLEEKTVIPLLTQLREAIDALQKTVDAAKNEASCKQITPSAEAVIKKGDEAVKAIRKTNITESNAASHTRNIQKLTNAIRSKCKKNQAAVSPMPNTTSTYTFAQAPQQYQAAPQMPQQPSLSPEEEKKQREEYAKSKDHMEVGPKYNYLTYYATPFDMILPLYKEYLKGDKKSTFGSFIDAKRTDSTLSILDKKTVDKLYEEYTAYSNDQGFLYSNRPSFTMYVDDRYTYKLENDPTLKAQTGGAKRRSLSGKRSKTRKQRRKRSSPKTRKH